MLEKFPFLRKVEGEVHAEERRLQKEFEKEQAALMILEDADKRLNQGHWQLSLGKPDRSSILCLYLEGEEEAQRVLQSFKEWLIS
jgi:hypothetical protein